MSTFDLGAERKLMGHFDHDLVAVAHPHEEHLEFRVSGFVCRFRVSVSGFSFGFRIRLLAFGFRFRVVGCAAGPGVGFRKIPEPVSVSRALLAWVGSLPKIATGTLICHRKQFKLSFRAKREQLKSFSGLAPESQGQNLALTVLYLPYSLDSGE